MAIRSSEYFIYNNIKSEDMGIINVSVGQSGMLSEPLTSGRSIMEQTVRGGKRYFQGIEREPFEFTVSFAFEDTWDDEKIREVTYWLTSPEFYAPMQFSDDLTRICYCLVTDTPELIHNGLKQGYINLTFRCADPYIYSPVIMGEIINLSANLAEGTAHIFDNKGDTNTKPIIYIEKIGNGNVSIFNQSNGNLELTFVDLVDGENLIIDCENEIIETDLNLIHRYNDMQGKFMSFVPRNNYLLIKGNCKLRFKYEFKYFTL